MMAPEPIFSGALKSEVKLDIQKDKQRKYYTHEKQAQLNTKKII